VSGGGLRPEKIVRGGYSPPFAFPGVTTKEIDRKMPEPAIATLQAAHRPEQKQYSTFFVGNLYFGVDVLDVQEVLKHQEMTPVPKANGVISGLINLRGQIVTAFDMRRRLNVTPRDSDKPPMNFVIRTEDGAVSLLVDEIGDVIEVKGEDFELAPKTVSEAAREMIEGVYKLEDRLLLVLSTQRVLQI
jgi:purine-binding chemotaxis protein CheW